MRHEKLELGILATVGLSKGVYEEYIRPELSAKRAWAGIALGVLAYELACPSGELLSQGVDRAIDKHPMATRAFIGYTAAHLCNLLPDKLDLYHLIGEARD